MDGSLAVISYYIYVSTTPENNDLANTGLIQAKSNQVASLTSGRTRIRHLYAHQFRLEFLRNHVTTR